MTSPVSVKFEEELGGERRTRRQTPFINFLLSSGKFDKFGFILIPKKNLLLHALVDQLSRGEVSSTFC